MLIKMKDKRNSVYCDVVVGRYTFGLPKLVPCTV